MTDDFTYTLTIDEPTLLRPVITLLDTCMMIGWTISTCWSITIDDRFDSFLPMVRPSRLYHTRWLNEVILPYICDHNSLRWYQYNFYNHWFDILITSDDDLRPMSHLLKSTFQNGRLYDFTCSSNILYTFIWYLFFITMMQYNFVEGLVSLWGELDVIDTRHPASVLWSIDQGRLYHTRRLNEVMYTYQ